MRVTEVFSLTLSLLLRFPLRAADKVRTGVTEERSGGRRSEVSPPGGKKHCHLGGGREAPLKPQYNQTQSSTIFQWMKRKNTKYENNNNRSVSHRSSSSPYSASSSLSSSAFSSSSSSTACFFQPLNGVKRRFVVWTPLLFFSNPLKMRFRKRRCINPSLFSFSSSQEEPDPLLARSDSVTSCLSSCRRESSRSLARPVARVPPPGSSSSSSSPLQKDA